MNTRNAVSGRYQPAPRVIDCAGMDEYLDDAIATVLDCDAAIEGIKGKRAPAIEAIKRELSARGDGGSFTYSRADGVKAIYSVPAKGAEFFDFATAEALVASATDPAIRDLLGTFLTSCTKRRKPASPSVRVK